MTHGHNTFEEKQQNVALGAGMRTLTETHSHLSIYRELCECVASGHMDDTSNAITFDNIENQHVYTDITSSLIY